MKAAWLLVPLAIAAVVVAVVVSGGDGGERAEAARDAEAPIAPRGVPAPPVCASDPPGEGGAEDAEARPVQLPLPSPERFAPEKPQRAVAEFLDAWHDRAWDRMALWTAASWRIVVPGSDARVLRRQYSTYRLRGWALTPQERDPSVARFDVLVAYRDLRPEIVRERLRFVVNREDPQGRIVTEGGRWGVLLAENPSAGARCVREPQAP